MTAKKSIILLRLAACLHKSIFHIVARNCNVSRKFCGNSVNISRALALADGTGNALNASGPGAGRAVQASSTEILLTRLGKSRVLYQVAGFVSALDGPKQLE